MDSISGHLVVVIERCWQAIQDRHADVPGVIVTLGAGSGRRGGLTLGHFAPGRWTKDEAQVHELFIGGEGLARGARGVMGTLLHEAAHGIAQVRGIQDTSRQGRWHNKRFKVLAEELGLEITEAPGIGWSTTTVPTRTAARYGAEITALDQAIKAYRRSEALTAGGKAPSWISAVCACRRRIRAARTTLAAEPILCTLCGTPFLPENTEPEKVHGD